MAESSELVRSIYLDIQILDPYKLIFIKFQIFYTVKLANSVLKTFFFSLLDAWAKNI